MSHSSSRPSSALFLRAALALAVAAPGVGASFVACSSSSDKGAVADGGIHDATSEEDAEEAGGSSGGGSSDAPTGPYPDAHSYTSPDGCALAGGACLQGSTCCSGLCGDAGVCNLPNVQQ